MAVPEHLDVLKLGTPEWNRWRKQNPSIVPDLSSAHLQTVRLAGANLSGARFTLTYFGDADLAGANLSGADLSQVYLRNASLQQATLEERHAGRSGARCRRFSHAREWPAPTCAPPVCAGVN